MSRAFLACSSSSARKSGWAIEMRSRARSASDWPLRLTHPYSVTTYMMSERGVVTVLPRVKLKTIRLLRTWVRFVGYSTWRGSSEARGPVGLGDSLASAAAHIAPLKGGREADERLAARRRVRPTHKLQLATGAADMAHAVGFGGSLTAEINLRRIVDRDHLAGSRRTTLIFGLETTRPPEQNDRGKGIRIKGLGSVSASGQAQLVRFAFRFLHSRFA